MTRRVDHLKNIEALLKKAVANQEKHMTALNDLKTAVADIAADAANAHDEVTVALDHILKDVNLDDNPDLKAAVESLHGSHDSLTESLKELKDKVDAVLASGGTP